MAHSSCGNSSNLSGNLNVRSITNSGARLFMTHDLSGFSGGRVSAYIGDDGVTAGDAIRYDVVQYLSDGVTESPSFQKYRKAQADTAENSEVVGIIESIDDSIVSVVLSGQIIYPSSKLVNATHVDETLGTSGATGGNDIYFLSEVTAGAIQNLAPSEPTRIAKPILQQAADGTFSHHVVNYIGYQIGGSVIASTDDSDDAPTLRSFVDVDGSGMNLNSNEWDASKINFAPITRNDPHYINKTFKNITDKKLKNRTFGSRFCFTSDVAFIESLWLNKRVWFIDSLGARIWEGTCEQINDLNRPNINCIYVRTTESPSNVPPISVKLHSSSGESIVCTSYEETGVALPQLVATSKSRARTIEGKTVSISQGTIITLKSDQGDDAVTIPSQVTMKDLTVTNSVKLENTTNSIDDVVGTIKSLSDEMTSIRREVNGLSSSASASAANITTKS